MKFGGACLCAVLSALSIHGKTTTVAELMPDGTNDMTAAVMAAVDRARAEGGGRIVFASGDYHFKSPRQMSFYVSNHDNPMPRSVFLPMTNLVGVTFESSAARFVCHGEGIACTLLDTDAVTVKGVAFDYSRPYFTEWRLRGGKLTTDKQTYPYEIDADGKITATGPGWREKQTLAAFFDRLTRVYLGCEWWDGKADHRFTRYPEGTVVVTRNGYRPNPCVFLYRAKDSVFAGGGVYSSAGMGLIAQRCENVTITDWRTRRDRFTGLQADATHFSNCRGLVSVTDSCFEGMVDDAINVHSTCLKIVEKGDGRKIVCQYMHRQSVGFEDIEWLLGALSKHFAPVAVKGDIQWGINRTENGWLLYLINNAGVIKFGDKPPVYLPGGSDVTVDLSRIGMTKPVRSLRTKSSLSAAVGCARS